MDLPASTCLPTSPPPQLVISTYNTPDTKKREKYREEQVNSCCHQLLEYSSYKKGNRYHLPAYHSLVVTRAFRITPWLMCKPGSFLAFHPHLLTTYSEVPQTQHVSGLCHLLVLLLLMLRLLLDQWSVEQLPTSHIPPQPSLYIFKDDLGLLSLTLPKISIFPYCSPIDCK